MSCYSGIILIRYFSGIYTPYSLRIYMFYSFYLIFSYSLLLRHWILESGFSFFIMLAYISTFDFGIGPNKKCFNFYKTLDSSLNICAFCLFSLLLFHLLLISSLLVVFFSTNVLKWNPKKPYNVIQIVRV